MHDWLIKVHQPNQEQRIDDVKAYMRYYNLERLHARIDETSLIEYKNYKRDVSEMA